MATDVAGFPPVKVQLYDNELVPGVQFSTIATGLIVIGPQESAIASILAVGGFLTVTTLDAEVVPQELSIPKVMV